MRRILIRTATLGVAAGLVLIAGPLLAAQLWLQGGGEVSADLGVEPGGAGAEALVLAAVLLLGTALALALTWAVATRRAARVGGLLSDLGERAERLGSGDARPGPLACGIEEVDRLDAALARGARQGAVRLATERDFAADASHQLRTPLTALLMRLEEIAVTDDLGVVGEEAGIAIAQVERLSSVVDDLMSRTRSGIDASPTVSLDSVLASLQREWQQAFTVARRSILVSGERGLRVRATPVALGQILSTLLENSLTHGRGTVEISARRAGPSVVIEVSDRGEGVSRTLAPHIFERSVSTGGSGLGLTLARDLAEAAGGRLELVSAQPPVFALFLSASTD
ncbi:MAG: HAMP domain-containing sensor histidine kinase [Ornithinibacter sp.]